MRLPVAAVAVVGVLAIGVSATGCSSSHSNKKKSTTVTTRFPPTIPVKNQSLSEGEGVCGLLTQAEVTATVGLQAQPGNGVVTDAGKSSCRWLVKGTGTQEVSVIEVVSDAKAVADAARAQAPSVQDLPGIGDSAFFSSDTAYVSKGTKLIIVAVVTTQAEAVRKAAVTKLATAAIGRV